MKCDELKTYDIMDIQAIDDERTKDLNPGQTLHCTRVCIAADVDDAIAELKDKLHDIDNQWNEQCKEIAELKAEKAQLKKEIEFMHSNCKWSDGSGCARLLGEKLALIDDMAELKAENERLKSKLESVQASAYADSVDAGMENRRLRRVLWLARAERAHKEVILFRYLFPCLAVKEFKWRKIENLCREKVEEYK